MTFARALRRSLLPAGVFIAVVGIHFLWLGFFPEEDPVQSRWASVPETSRSWFAQYLERQDFWLGITYAMPAAFAAFAFRRYREERLSSARSLAIGGVTLSGILSVVGCFLIGCCGSPMLGVYASLLGAAFLPFLKPVLALITACFIAFMWWRMEKKRRTAGTAASGPGACADSASCDCSSPAAVAQESESVASVSRP